jgi:hypothetical protein
MQGAYSSYVPLRQFGSWTAEENLILNQTQDRILHQLLGIGTGFGGYLRKLRRKTRRGSNKSGVKWFFMQRAASHFTSSLPLVP